MLAGGGQGRKGRQLPKALKMEDAVRCDVVCDVPRERRIKAEAGRPQGFEGARREGRPCVYIFVEVRVPEPGHIHLHPGRHHLLAEAPHRKEQAARVA